MPMIILGFSVAGSITAIITFAKRETEKAAEAISTHSKLHHAQARRRYCVCAALQAVLNTYSGSSWKAQ